jgi:hypothetical protein
LRAEGFIILLDHAHKLIDLFTEANGRRPRNTQELGSWIDSAEGKAALAYGQTPDGKIIP